MLQNEILFPKLNYGIKNMIKSKLFFLFCLFVFYNPIFANLRAPWSVSRYPSYSLPFVSSQLLVLKEDLVFTCDKTFEGDGNISKIKEQSCDVEVLILFNLIQM